METKEEVQNAVPVEVIKPKKERTEKQVLSFSKARMVLLEKQKAKLDADLNSIKKNLPSGKKKKEPIAEPVVSEVKEPVVSEPVAKPKKVKVKVVEPPSDSSSEEEEEMTVQKSKKAPKEAKTPRKPQNEIIQPKTPRKPHVKKSNDTPMNSPIVSEPTTNRNPYSTMLSKYRY